MGDYAYLLSHRHLDELQQAIALVRPVPRLELRDYQE
jgi:hypothetical protein